MSEPASHSDIEDVLSSIRRLVSEETRTPSRGETPKTDENKLVLTPSLRVSDPDPAPVKADEPAENPAPQQRKDAPPWADPGATLFGAASSAAENSNEIDEIIMGVEAMLPAREKPADDLADAVDLTDRGTWDGRDDDAPDAVADEASDDDREDVRAPLTLSQPIIADEPADPVDAAEEIDADVVDHDQPQATDPLDTLSAKIEALEAAVQEKDEHWEPDEPGSDDYAGTQVGAMTLEDRPTDLETHADAFDPAHDDAFAAVPDLEAEEVEIDAPQAEALEPDHMATPEAEIDEPAEPDADVEFVPEADHDQSVVAEDQPEPEVLDVMAEQPSDEAVTDSEPEARGVEDLPPQPMPGPKPVYAEVAEPDIEEDLLAEEALLDEESLREIVTDIVRQELQGALGERITRNVRKLVRREIHRALTAQDFD